MSSERNLSGATRHAHTPFGKLSPFIISLLLVEFLDELVFGVREAAWPLIRDDLALSYVQIGMLLSLPVFAGNVIEPALGILADVWKRRVLIMGGGVAFASALALVSVSGSFKALLVALVLLNPSSGAFVGLSQAALMDFEPHRREQNMARWTLSGSMANAFGPLALWASLTMGFGWRGLFAGMAVSTLLLLAAARRYPFTMRAAVQHTPPQLVHQETDAPPDEETRTAARQRAGAGASSVGRDFRAGVREAVGALRRREVWRWLVLLKFGDLTWDVLRGFLALYFVDVVGVDDARAATAIVIWTFAGLPGDFLLLPLLERVRGLAYLRWSTLCVLALFPALLLAPSYGAKLIVLGLLGFANAGWYSILKAQLYKAMPGRSGTVMTLGNISGLITGFFPFMLGAFAERNGLAAMMWLLLLGPLVLLIGLLTTPAET